MGDVMSLGDLIFGLIILGIAWILSRIFGVAEEIAPFVAILVLFLFFIIRNNFLI